MHVKLVNMRPLSKPFQPGIVNTPACTRQPLFDTVLFSLSQIMLSTELLPEATVDQSGTVHTHVGSSECRGPDYYINM